MPGDRPVFPHASHSSGAGGRRSRRHQKLPEPGDTVYHPPAFKSERDDYMPRPGRDHIRPTAGHFNALGFSTASSVSILIPTLGLRERMRIKFWGPFRYKKGENNRSGLW